MTIIERRRNIHRCNGIPTLWRGSSMQNIVLLLLMERTLLPSKLFSLFCIYANPTCMLLKPQAIIAVIFCQPNKPIENMWWYGIILMVELIVLRGTHKAQHHVKSKKNSNQRAHSRDIFYRILVCKLKSYCTELLLHGPRPSCCCGVITKMVAKENKDMIIQFLMELNFSFLIL